MGDAAAGVAPPAAGDSEPAFEDGKPLARGLPAAGADIGAGTAVGGTCTGGGAGTRGGDGAGIAIAIEGEASDDPTEFDATTEHVYRAPGTAP